MIAGIQKTSLIDYPGKICTTIFISECNFRCPYCHNPLLIKKQEEMIKKEEFLEFLNQRKNLIEGVCITGGEPTLNEELVELIKDIKNKNLYVKLDTNGSKPEIIDTLIKNKLVDYIAMDIKSSKENYHKASGSTINPDIIQRSIDIIKNSEIEYEFRTTIVKDFFDEEQANSIGNWLKGSKKYVLQQFNNQNKMLDISFNKKTPYTPDELKDFKTILEPFIDTVEIRGI